ncbi:unnamed protein product [Phytophthora fragariaefolia]|uniref:Unnamed protein product n=1 Tax=Phytophthora fragariaefolia TaxID=1490495 RepID=A0A9W6XX83_9STRA|nr:unnamed protein product [Phytophthora fragariaefolia]
MVAAVLREQVAEVKILDAPPAYIDGLVILLSEIERSFALELGRDPPVHMPPMEIKLKPGATRPTDLDFLAVWY